MHVLPVFFSFFVCFMYFDMIMSKPLNQSASQAVDQQLREYGRVAYTSVLPVYLSLASSGKNFFDQLETPMEDCVRTARVTMNLFTKPSTSEKIWEMIQWSADGVFNETKPSRNPVNTLCENINTAVKLSQFSVPDFEQLKNQVELPKPAKNYLVTVPEGQKPIEFLRISYTIDDKELFKYSTMMSFLISPYSVKKAILELSQRDDLKSSVDLEFIQVHDDYIKDLSAKTIYSDNNSVYNYLAPRIHNYFTTKSAHKEEYKKLIARFGEPVFIDTEEI